MRIFVKKKYIYAIPYNDLKESQSRIDVNTTIIVAIIDNFLLLSVHINTHPIIKQYNLMPSRLIL